MSDETVPRVLSYELEIPIQAPRERVWEALTAETNAWWLADFHVVGPESVVTLDARAGGGLVEAQPDGSSLLWYTVQMCVPGTSLHLVGHLAPGWGGPSTTMLELKLEDDGEGTRLVVRDAIFGKTSEESARSQEEGWRTLFSDGLRAHAEA